ncbi:MAG: hypothetical protein LBC79_02225 [Deltaproteobacteria bacterium]|jgi:hypothetical protein|nr:hypothetical protein [Deltaproteobacteria bacterium]
MEQQFAQYGKLALSHLSRCDGLLVLALLLCLAGLPLLAAAGQGLARGSGRGAYDKCARQLNHLCCWLGLIAIMAGGVALGMRYRGLPAFNMENYAAREHALPLLMVGGWLCVVFATLLNCLSMGLWRSRRTASRLHRFLGLLAALAAAAAVYAALVHLHTRAAPAPGDLRSLLMPGVEGFWAAAACAPFAALALAGGYGALWLLLRRVADDYGRDHYNLAIPWCAGWACNSWLLLWLVAAGRTGWRVFRLYESAGGRPDWIRFVPDGIGLAALLLPCLWWLGVSRSATPLRAKIAASLAPLWATGCLLLLDMELR